MSFFGRHRSGRQFQSRSSPSMSLSTCFSALLCGSGSSTNDGHFRTSNSYHAEDGRSKNSRKKQYTTSSTAKEEPALADEENRSNHQKAGSHEKVLSSSDDSSDGKKCASVKQIRKESMSFLVREENKSRLKDIEWEKMLDKGHQQLREDIARKRELKYRVKANMKKEKYAMEFMKKRMAEKNGDIEQKKKKITDMEVEKIVNNMQENLFLRLDHTYHRAKSKLRLNQLEQQLLRLQRDVERKRRKVYRLSHEAHKLAYSIPLVPEAGPLERDEERKLQGPLHTKPSVFVSSSSDNIEDQNKDPGTNAPTCWKSPSIISSLLVSNTASPKDRQPALPLSLPAESQGSKALEIINLD